MKSQVTLDLTNVKHIYIDTILMSIQHDEDIDEAKFKHFVITEIMEPVVQEFKMNLDFKVLINPTGRFVIGGPKGDAGLTGRKILLIHMVDMLVMVVVLFGERWNKSWSFSSIYGSLCRKNIVAAGLTERCEIQLSYAIGVAEPISILLKHLELIL